MHRQIETLLRDGKVDCADYEEAKRVGRRAESEGHSVHVNQPLGRFPASVEMCQGAHCHCRY